MQLFSLIVSLILAAIFCSIGIFAGCFAYRNKHSKTSWLQGCSVAIMFYFITCETVCTAVAKFKNVYNETVIQNVMPIFTLLAIAAAGVFVVGLVIEIKESKAKSRERLAKKTADTFNQEYQAQWPNPEENSDSTQSADSIIAEISKTAQEISDYIDAWYITEMANIERVFQKNKFVPEFAAEETAKESAEESAEETSKETVVVP